MTNLPVAPTCSSQGLSPKASLRSPQARYTTSQSPRLALLKRVTTAVASTAAIALNLWITPALADPFRPTNSHSIDAQTEAAFKAIFEQGNYRQAAELLQTAAPNEPLAYAMRASLAYLDGDTTALGQNATLTREAAERLLQTDPLRGHLYVAAGHFLEGAYTVTTQGTMSATPTVLRKLQQVFNHLGEAEKISPTDPELNLLKGYMDLMLAVNLPFANPQQAIERLQTHASPSYLADRGIALAYRDLNQQDLALQAVERALQQTPTNPDLLYLKAQILVRQQRQAESLPFFRRALAQREQLPGELVRQISYESCRADVHATGRQRACARFLNRS